METIKLIIPGEPVAKARARSRVVGEVSKRFVQHYTPKKTRSYENLVARCAKLQMTSMANASITGGPVTIKITMVFAIPKSWPKWKAELARTGEIMHTTKPDADNVEKAIKDGLNGIVWIDDSQVVRCEKEKRYCHESEEPFVRVEIRESSGYPSNVSRKPACSDQIDMVG